MTIPAWIEIAKAALTEALAFHGTQTAFSKAIRRNQQTISLWVRRGFVPADDGVCLVIERSTGGKVPKERLRPDVYDPAHAFTRFEQAQPKDIAA